MNDDFTATVQKHAKDLTVAEQRQAGRPVTGKMTDEHRSFLKNIIKLIDDGEIDVYAPETFLYKNVYEILSEEWRDKVDLSLLNIANQLRRIEEFYRSAETPDESPQLQTMVDYLWDMKQRIEIDKDHDVFKF